MQNPKRLTQLYRPIGLTIIFFMVLSCRTSDMIRQFADNQIGTEEITADIESVQDTMPVETETPNPVVASEQRFASATQVAGPIPAERPTLAPPAGSTPTWIPFPTQRLVAPTAGPTPTWIPFPDELPATRAPARAPVRASAKTATPTKISATPTPHFEYQVSLSWCGPNWQTFVEGTVTQGGVAKDGLLVRISLDPDGSPTWSDYKTGTDPTKPGGYTQIIDANAPHDGLWRLWVVDPKTNQRISEIANVKTDPKRVEETSCQSATVNFSN